MNLLPASWSDKHQQVHSTSMVVLCHSSSVFGWMNLPLTRWLLETPIRFWFNSQFCIKLYISIIFLALLLILHWIISPNTAQNIKIYIEFELRWQPINVSLSKNTQSGSILIQSDKVGCYCWQPTPVCSAVSGRLSCCGLAPLGVTERSQLFWSVGLACSGESDEWTV